MLKTTSPVLAVSFTLELQFATNAIANRIYKPIPLVIVACIWYLVITSIPMIIQSRLERHFGKGFESRTAVAVRPDAGGPAAVAGADDAGAARVAQAAHEAKMAGLNA